MSNIHSASDEGSGAAEAAAPSPLPWSLEHFPNAGDFDATHCLCDARGKSLMSDPEYYPYTPSKHEDWVLIVRAVNSHDALVKALESCKETRMSMLGRDAPEGVIYSFDVEAVRAALALTKG